MSVPSGARVGHRRSRLPTPQFYYGMERGADVAVELEPGKTLVVKFQTLGDPHPDGTRTVFFELNGQPREVWVGSLGGSPIRHPVRDRL